MKNIPSFRQHTKNLPAILPAGFSPLKLPE